MKKTVVTKGSPNPASGTGLVDLAFQHSGQASLIMTSDGSKILAANAAACKILGYSKKQIITKDRSSIFDIEEVGFKSILKKQTADGGSSGTVTIIKKTGEKLRCQITYVHFKDEDGRSQAICTITDTGANIEAQNNIDKKKEKEVALNITLAKLKQKSIDISNRKAVARDISIAKVRQQKLDTKSEKVVAENIIAAQEKSDARLEENNEWIKCIAKNSYDVMWDWNILTGEIYVGDSIEEVFGYKVKNNTSHFKHFGKCLQPEEKEAVLDKITLTLASDSKDWSDSYSFKRSNGTVAFTTSRASIVRDESGKAIRLIGAIHDITRVQELEGKLEENIAISELQNEKSLMAATRSFGVMWDWKIFTNEILIAEGFEELFGYHIENNIGDKTAWSDHIHADDKERIEKGFAETLQSERTTWQEAYRFTRADGSATRIFNRASIFRDAEGKAYRVIGLMQDIGQPVRSVGNQQLSLSKSNSIISKIKEVIIELFNHSDEVLQTNFSHFISQKLQYDYNYLSNLFSEMEGMPIRQFIIEQKIHRAKELIIKNELTLTQIAAKLHYSSIAHLSNQFKKVTGLTPSHFKELHPKADTGLQKA